MAEPNGQAEAHQAKNDASEQLRRVQSRWQSVYEVTFPLKEIRARNHFAEQLATAFGGSLDDTR